MAILLPGVLTTLFVAQAAAATSTGRVAVDFVAEDREERWFAGALALTLERELTRFDQVRVADPLPPDACPSRDLPCLLAKYDDLADVVVLGTVTDGTLRWEVYETWTGSRVDAGRIRTRGAVDNLDELQARLGHVVRPIVGIGGALESRPLAAAAAARAEQAAPVSRRALQAIFLAAMLLFLSPAFVRRVLLAGARTTPRRPASWRASVTLAALCLAAAVALLAPVPFAVPALVSSLAPFLAGGLLWGAVVLLGVRLVVPVLQGVERMRHEALAPLLRAWTKVALRRAALVFLAGGAIFSIATLVFRSAGLDARTTGLIGVPAAALAVWFWVLTLADHVSLTLDHALVEGAASRQNAWHYTMARYFRGYVRRGGLDLDAATLDRVLFLPAKPGHALTCFGGGLSHPRVLVPPGTYEAALGPLPDEVEMPERTVNPEELPFGFVVPSLTESDAHAETLAGRLRRDAGAAPARGRAQAPPSIGENATLLGWVMPQQQDTGMPLISDSQEDFDVVRELLTMHYSGFEKNLEEGEYDDTDPTQKDFLFGALLREIGRCQRGESVFETLRLALALQLPRMSAPTRAVARVIGETWTRFFAGDGARVADAYAVVNGARDHLIQHLYRVFSPGEQDLTARAPAPRLYERSKAMLDAVLAQEPRGKEAQAFRETVRNRLLWLSEYLPTTFHALEERRVIGLRMAAAAVAVAGLTLTVAVRSAVVYRPVYEARIKDMERRVAEEKAEEEAEQEAEKAKAEEAAAERKEASDGPASTE